MEKRGRGIIRFRRGIICLLLSVKATAGMERLLAWFMVTDAPHESHFAPHLIGGLYGQFDLHLSQFPSLISTSAASLHNRRSARIRDPNELIQTFYRISFSQ